jgi:hypothetical protein
MDYNNKNRGRKRKNVLAPRSRTLATVEAALADLTMSSGIPRVTKQAVMPYLHCRFESAPSASRVFIPDGKGSHIISAEHRSSYDLSLGGATLVRIMPGLPYTVLVYTAVAYTVNGVAGKTSSLGAAQPLVAANGYVDTIDCQNTNTSTFSATRARFIANKIALSYTGTSQSASGYVTASSIPFAIDMIAPNPGVITWGLGGGATATVTSIANQVKQATTDLPSYNLNPLYPDTIRLRPEPGIKASAKLSSRDHAFVPFHEQPIAIIQDSNLSGGTANSMLLQSTSSTAVSNYRAGYQILDDNMAAIDIYFSVGNSYTLDVISCVEYEVSPLSSFAPLSTGSPQLDEHALAVENQINAIMPTAIPGSTPVSAIVSEGMKLANSAPSSISNMVQEAVAKAKQRSENKAKQTVQVKPKAAPVKAKGRQK